MRKDLSCYEQALILQSALVCLELRDTEEARRLGKWPSSSWPKYNPLFACHR
ncbi:hypothetical protein LINPERPRIM_LOCUS4660 [Linum perenne]